MNHTPELREILTADMTSAFNSILRIISTIIIYIFHCDAQYNFAFKDHLFYAFTFFLFISGYYSFFNNESPNKWIKKRLKRIYIPYWIVLTIVILANFIFHYKKVGIKELFFAFIGGNLFIDHKIYVIAWFISVIISLYVCVYIFKIFKNIVIKLAIVYPITLLLLHFDIPYDFFISFILGYFTHAYIVQNELDNKVLIRNTRYVKLFNAIFRPILYIQNYSYEFFLVHGGVILFFAKVLRTDYAISMVGGIILSFLGAIILKYIARKIDLFFQKKATTSGSTLNIFS